MWRLGWLVVVGCGQDDGPPCGAVARPTVTAGTGGNLLVVLLDDVGADVLGSYGGPVRTPTVDCLCERGVRFDRAWGAPLCSPGRAAFATGRQADRTGMGRNVDRWIELPEDEETIGEVMGAAGYHTAWVGKWHLDGWMTDHGIRGPQLQGFDVFDGTIANLDLDRGEGRVGDYRGYWRVSDGRERWTRGYATTVTVDDALRFLDDAPEPWLLVLALHAGHVPLDEPPRRLLAEKVANDASPELRYRAVVEAADHELGRLLRAMDPTLLADTTVVVTADNGTSEEGAGEGRVKGTLFEGGLRVPFVVSGPHVAAPGRTSDGLVSLVDLLPTFAAIAGATPTALLDGVDLVPLLTDPEAAGPDFTTAVWEPESVFERAIRDDRYKLVRTADGDRLYDLGTSPDESVDLLAGALDPDAAAAVERLSRALGEGPGAARFR